MDELTLVPFDGSPLSRRALERAIGHHPGGPIVVLYVIDPLLAVYEAETAGLSAARDWDRRMGEVADEVCAEARDLAAASDCEITVATAVGRPDREILAYVDEHDVDHVVMGSNGRRGVSRLVLGSVAERVVRGAPVPVTVVR
jgi:nucleotide-binding universal stress UspA family protein